MKLEIAFFWVAVLLVILAIFLNSGCASDPKRKRLQDEWPDCFVSEDLEISCPPLWAPWRNE